MRKKRILTTFFTIGLFPVLLSGCFSSDSGNPILSQTYVHKYGFEVPENEWQEREEEGQIVTLLKNGVKVVRNYENGLLHGTTTFTFPHSPVVEKVQVYDQGVLLKEVVHDETGVPIREEASEFDQRMVITLWDEKGAPISIEEFEKDLLLEGKYYNPSHELEAQVEAGFGERIKRDRNGLLISRDLVENGIMATRTSYHPNGVVHTISHYLDSELHGVQQKFTSTGKPLLTLEWNRGILDGTKIVFRNGVKVAEIPYVKGEKYGTEFHFDDLGNLTAEIHWKHDKKHGPTKFYTDESVEQEWFYKGQVVDLEQFEILSTREKILEETRDIR